VNLVGNQPALDIPKKKSAFLGRETDFLWLEIRRRPDD
jgi:hypothetical protein